jgi:hypothetical protein
MDEAYSIQQTTDGGFVVAGYTNSFGGSDLWVLKLDADGNVGPAFPGTWQKIYGGLNWDGAYSIQQTTDGGYIVAGDTQSFGAGSLDFWVLKLDADGNVGPAFPGTWQKTYGGASSDVAWFIQQTSEGGYVVAGETQSFGAGSYDLWVLKLDVDGNVGPAFPGTWQKTYGGASSDVAWFIQQTSDGGFVVAGGTESFGVGGGFEDFWILKMDANGEIDASCTFIADTAVTGADSTATPADTAVTGVDSPAPTDTTATVADYPPTVSELCPCPILSCDGIAVDADPVCDGTSQTFTANTTGGVAPLTVDWDFSYDGVFNVEGKGNPITYTQPAAGSYTVAAQVTDSCINPPPQTCIATVATTIEGSPNVDYDAAFDPATTLAEICGDGDLIVEPGEEWQVTVQLINNAAACTANNVKADLTVNASSVVAATVCNNPGAYGNIPPGGTEQFTYSFVVDSLAVCVNDITFDVTNIVSDEGAYPDGIAAFGVTVGQVTETAVQATDPLMVKNDIISSLFAPAFILGSPVTSAELSYTLTHDGGAADLLDCTKVELLDPAGDPTLIKDFGKADPLKPVDVTGSYIGKGTYELQLTEASKGCGSGSATISSGTLTVSDTGCDLSACACSPSADPAAVPDGGAVPGTPLMVADAGGGAVTLTWDAACNATDYAVMAGDLSTLGSGYNHAPSVCTDAGGDLTETIAPAGTTLYFLVVPHNGASEGSYGTDSDAVERPPAVGACYAQSIGSCI